MVRKEFLQILRDPSSIAIASRLTPLISSPSPSRRFTETRKCSTSEPMSSRRARSGGTSSTAHQSR